MKNNRIIDITDKVKWIGILDYDIVTFDIVMKTDYGTTYNSYFIDAEKKTIIDTSKEKFEDEYIQKVKEVVDPSEISYIVLNHTEPDHSGNLKALLELAPNAMVVGSGNAIRYLQDIIGTDFSYLQVKNGDELSLGDKTLKFIGAPNLHWPDTIYTYLVEDKLLFTCDSFGCHYCNEDMFDDEVGDFNMAFDYYFDVILKPYSKFVLKAIEKIRPLDIEMVCPGHGPILRSHWKNYVDRSEKFAKEYLKIIDTDIPTVLIAYVTAYGYTHEMAKAISEGIRQSGNIKTVLIDLEFTSLGEMEEKLTGSSALLVGSPTINQNTLFPIYKLFAVVNPIRDKGKPAASFGSFGWSGEAIGIVEQNLKMLKFKLFDTNASYKFYPQKRKADELIAYGKAFGEFVLSQIRK